MANYRPKSLDELNNLYGKSLNAQQEIAKKANVLEEKTQLRENAPVAEEKAAEYKIREQEAEDQIAGYVNDFIRSFGTPAKPDRTAAATVTASMKTVPVGKPAEPKKENEAVIAAAENQSEDKPRLIRNSERNSLFENYKKVMDDEDDYDFSDEEKSEKKKPKKLFDKKSSKTVEENKADEAAEESKRESEKVTEAKAEEPAKPVAEKKAEAIAETEVEIKAEAEEEKSEKKKSKKVKSKKEKKQKAPEEKKQKTAEKSKGTVSRAIVMLLILCVLLCATAVGGTKAFSGINTDSLVMGKYLVYTADRDYTRLGINEGDLVVVERKGIDYDDIFAYQKNANEFAFARLTTVLNDESVIADDGDLRNLVFNDTVRGVVCKTIPAVGTVAALIMSDFLAVMGVLLALVFILMLIAIFGCKPKEGKAKKEKAQKVKPEKAKKEKKNKKSKKTSGEEASHEDEAQQKAEDQEEAEDDFDYAGIEADFSFLLNTFDEDNDYEEYAGSEPAYAEASHEADEEIVAPAEEASVEEAPAEESNCEEAADNPAEEDAPELAVKYEISDEADEEITE